MKKARIFYIIVIALLTATVGSIIEGSGYERT